MPVSKVDDFFRWVAALKKARSAAPAAGSAKELALQRAMAARPAPLEAMSRLRRQSQYYDFDRPLWDLIEEPAMKAKKDTDLPSKFIDERLPTGTEAVATDATNLFFPLERKLDNWAEAQGVLERAVRTKGRSPFTDDDVEDIAKEAMAAELDLIETLKRINLNRKEAKGYLKGVQSIAPATARMGQAVRYGLRGRGGTLRVETTPKRELLNRAGEKSKGHYRRPTSPDKPGTIVVSPFADEEAALRVTAHEGGHHAVDRSRAVEYLQATQGLRPEEFADADEFVRVIKSLEKVAKRLEESGEYRKPFAKTTISVSKLTLLHRLGVPIPGKQLQRLEKWARSETSALDPPKDVKDALKSAIRKRIETDADVSVPAGNLDEQLSEWAEDLADNFRADIGTQREPHGVEESMADLWAILQDPAERKGLPYWAKAEIYKDLPWLFPEMTESFVKARNKASMARLFKRKE